MKIWAPYTHAKSGSTVFTHNLAKGLEERGFAVVLQEFPHLLQFWPRLLRLVPPPPGTDVILTNTWNGPGFHRSGIPSIFVEHLFVLDPRLRKYKSLGQSLFHEWLVKGFVRESYETASRVVSVSEYTKRAVLEIFPSAKLQVIRNGIDETFFTPPEQPRARADTRPPFRLLFAGNLTRRKGADLLPDIMEHLGLDYVLRYTGDSKSAPGNFDAPNMVALGRLSRDQIREEYRRCDALIAPTRMEGLPLAVLEAAACGMPIIASDSASLPEVVIDHETGLICPVDDAAGFADAARYLRENPNETTAMGLNARTMVERKFSFSRMVENYVDLITTLA